MAKKMIRADLLYASLDAARTERGLSWRALAQEIGVSPSLLSRLGNGYKPYADGFATLVAWLKMPADQFFQGDDQPAVGSESSPTLMAQLAPLLRARKDLSESDIKYLEQVIAATVEHVKAQG